MRTESQGGASLCPGLSPCAPLGHKTIGQTTTPSIHSTQSKTQGHAARTIAKSWVSPSPFCPTRSIRAGLFKFLAVGCGLNEITPLASSSGTSHPLPSSGRRREERFHRLATGGYGDRWLRRQVVLGARSRSFSRYSKPCKVLKAKETLSANGSAFNPKSLSPTSAIPAI